MTKLLVEIWRNNVQKNLFYGSLMDMLDSKDPLVVLADTIKWSKFEDEFAQYYSKEEDQLNQLFNGWITITKTVRKS